MYSELTRGRVIIDSRPLRPLYIGAESLVVRVHESLNQKVLSPFSPLRISGDSLIKQNAAVFLGSHSGRGTVLDMIVTHATGQVSLIITYLSPILELFPESHEELGAISRLPESSRLVSGDSPLRCSNLSACSRHDPSFRSPCTASLEHQSLPMLLVAPL